MVLFLKPWKSGTVADATGDAAGFKLAQAAAEKAVALAPEQADGYAARSRSIPTLGTR